MNKKKPKGIYRRPTDKQRMDWLEKQSNGAAWIARQSTTGRGFRLHNAWDSMGFPSARLAIDWAMRDSK